MITCRHRWVVQYVPSAHCLRQPIVNVWLALSSIEHVLLLHHQNLLLMLISWEISCLKLSRLFKLRFKSNGLCIAKAVRSLSREYMTLIKRWDNGWNEGRLDVTFGWDASSLLVFLLTRGAVILLNFRIHLMLLFLNHFIVDRAYELILLDEIFPNLGNLLS
jgi:hypothetical protein